MLENLPPVYVDASLIVQVFANLLDNAAKYTPPGTQVSVTGAIDGTFVRVIVDDEGPGLPPGDPAQAVREIPARRRRGTIVGVGLGLAICRAIVQSHGGTIDARSRPGGGARFEFTLPTTEPEA